MPKRKRARLSCGYEKEKGCMFGEEDGSDFTEGVVDAEE